MQGDGHMVGSAELLASMAAAVASGIEANPNVTGLDADDVAERAVTIAEAIVERVTTRSAS